MARSFIPREQDDIDYDDKARAALGQKIEKLMLDLGLCQSELARKAGLRRDAISTYVRGRVWPNPQSFAAVARALGVTPHALRPGASEIAEVVGRPANDRPPSRIAATLKKSGFGGHTMGNDKALTSLVQSKPGYFHVSIHQEMPADHAMRILAIVSELGK